ncbi:MAG: hypothetical protein SFU21_06070, partial [Flavihumibacter sp.]|nr:hypothetical protein [Flavihumibacter sp.]
SLEYHSNQIMRIRVYGSKSTLLLENNYPIIQVSKGTQGVKWKIKEGNIEFKPEESSWLLTQIMENLEHAIKKDFPKSNGRL